MLDWLTRTIHGWGLTWGQVLFGVLFSVVTFVVSIAVLPNRSLAPRGRRFAADFERRFSQRPCCFSVHEAQATRMMLDAIARSGGDRARVSQAIMTAEIRNGLVGDFSIDRNGDTTLNQMGMYRIREGRSHFETVITPAPELLPR